MAGLSEDLIAALCPKLCQGPITITVSQKRLMPDGSVEVSGERPRSLCSGCPERNHPNSPIRHLEVRYGFEPGADHGEVVSTESAAPEDVGMAVIVVLYDNPEQDPM